MGFEWFVLLASVVALAAMTIVAVSRGRELAARRGPADVARLDELDPSTSLTTTSIKAGETQTSVQQRDMSALVDLVGVGIIRVGDDLRIGLANVAAHAFLGAAPGSLVGRTAMEAFIDHGVELILRRAMVEGAANGELVARDGERPTLLIRARRSPATGIWLVLEDVTELRRLQRIRAEFVDNLSHELRTPITTVRLLAETLTREMDEAGASDRARDMVAKIDVETGHLAQMVSELLDLTKIEQGGAPLYLDDVDLRLIVRDSIERLTLFAERQGVTLTADLPDEPLVIRGDDDRLGQVLVNLLHNAVKFSPDGGQVVASARVVDREVVVSIADQGVGIPRADLDRVFERFYKVDKARVRGKGGTGLGLAIARHIVEGHGGRIWAESVEGHGATFYFAIPARDLAEAA